MPRSEDTIRRIFIALDLTDEVRHGLSAHLADWLPLPGSAPPPANWHITLRFLGKMDQVAYETLLARLYGADLGPPFELAFGALGAFPRPARATVLWLGTEAGSHEVADLAAVVEQSVVEAGFMPEERPFHPHLTLSRIRPPQDVRPLIEAVPPFPLVQVVDRVTVFESHLGRGPATYDDLECFELSA
jgi:2'-5' RNA ligase